ncbi:MAG TPA: phage portal protein [Dysgonamonadaceae bacterium]|nr:phage portal protein [Dysgonamonadaceae bacterium]
MGWFNRLFTPQAQKDADRVTEYLETINGYTPSFQSFDGGMYETELIRSVVHAKAKHTAKLTPHVIGSAYKNFESVLKHKPNEFQSIYDFLYRLRTLYEVDTYAFIVPIYTEGTMHIKGLYPLKTERVELKEIKGVVYLRYLFNNGKRAMIPYEEVGVLKKMNYRDEHFGDGNQVLHNSMSLIDLQNQGIQDAIRQSAKIRFMARIGQNMRPEDIEKERENFSKTNLSSDNQSGVMMFDTKYVSVDQIKSQPYTADEKQIEFIKNNVYSYFGINEDILQNKFNEDTWNAFYEGEVEPFAIQLSQAITNMMFTSTQKAHGNEIHFSANRLQYASNTTKLEVSRALFDRGIFGSDDVAEIWNLPKTGDNRKYIRKEYAEMLRIDDDTITQVEVDEEIDKEVDKQKE